MSTAAPTKFLPKVPPTAAGDVSSIFRSPDHKPALRRAEVPCSEAYAELITRSPDHRILNIGIINAQVN
jgi:hypothetical protein